MRGVAFRFAPLLVESLLRGLISSDAAIRDARTPACGPPLLEVAEMV